MRPLLDVTREETRAYCAAHGLAGAGRRDESRDRARADPGRDPAAAAAAASGRRREPARARRASGRGCRAALEASLVDLLASRAGHEGGRPRRRRARRARVRDAAARGNGRVGAVDARERPRRSRGARAVGRGIIWQGAARRCRICSWTRRCRGPSATPGRSSSTRGEVVAVPGIADGARLGRRRHGAEGATVSEIDHGVGEILIEEHAVKERVARARRRDLGRLRRSRPPARRRAQGRGVLHGRPDARALDPVRDRLHGDLELRRRDRLVGRRAHPQGPRHQHRGPRRPRRRGHHRLRADALVPDAQPAGAQAGLARGLRPPDEARSAARSTFPCGTSASRSRTSS